MKIIGTNDKGQCIFFHGFNRNMIFYLTFGTYTWVVNKNNEKQSKGEE